jgi:cytochrome c biogenesis protein CcmG/thiol:disulfide interchange protein DsbE
MKQATSKAVAVVEEPRLMGFDVSIAALLFLILILLQPRLAFGSDKAERVFKTANQKLNEAVGLGPVYVDFWASWCGPCKESLPWLSSLKKQGIKVVTVNLDSERKNAEELLKELKVADLSVVYDPTGKVAEEQELTSMPESLLVGRGGKIVSIHSGFNAEERQAREEEIRAAFK